MGYAALRWVMCRLLHLLFGLILTGTEHIPASGAVILAAHHASQMDPLVLFAGVPRRTGMRGGSRWSESG